MLFGEKLFAAKDGETMCAELQLLRFRPQPNRAKVTERFWSHVTLSRALAHGRIGQGSFSCKIENQDAACWV